MDDIFLRNRMLLGEAAVKRLAKSSAAVFGLGGVGGFAAEALVRAGIGSITIVDYDTVSPSNINRQIIATASSVGRLKTEVMAERLLSINPELDLKAVCRRFLPGDEETIHPNLSYIIDAVDMVTAKIELVLQAGKYGIPIISCMGTGNKIYPELLKISDIYKTSVCPLAKVMRKELRVRGISSLKCVYSTEASRKPFMDEAALLETKGKKAVGSISFVPPVAGLMLAGEVIRNLAEVE